MKHYYYNFFFVYGYVRLFLCDYSIYTNENNIYKTSKKSSGLCNKVINV